MWVQSNLSPHTEPLSILAEWTAWPCIGTELEAHKESCEILQVGDTIEVYVISFDKENKRISLGHRLPEDNPGRSSHQNMKQAA